MYAVIRAGGHQYRVAVNQVIRVEKLDAPAGAEIELGEVLLLGGEDGVKVGTPVVPGARVTAKVLRQGRGRKIVGFTYKPKKNQRRRYGHRQWFTEVQISAIHPGEGAAAKE